MFTNIYLGDMYVLVAELLVNSANNNNRVMANKQISCHRLLVDTSIRGNLWGSLRGVFKNRWIGRRSLMRPPRLPSAMLVP
jgi:hypothetical protein